MSPSGLGYCPRSHRQEVAELELQLNSADSNMPLMLPVGALSVWLATNPRLICSLPPFLPKSSMMYILNSWTREPWIQTPVPPLTSCMTLGKLFNLSVPLLPHP